MKNTLANILLFQKPLLISTSLVSVILGLLIGGELKSIGALFFIFILVMHFINYEIKHKKEYYYYYNLGISKLMLWISTFFIGLISFIILSIL